jgi:HTH-like domain
VANQPRGTQRYLPTQRDDEDALTRAIITLASQYGRFGYRRITIELQKAGWPVGKDRVERIWRREGLKVPKKQKPRGRLWLNDGSCVRLRPEHRNQVQDAVLASLAQLARQMNRCLPVVRRPLPRCCRDSVVERVVRECCQCWPQRETLSHP